MRLLPAGLLLLLALAAAPPVLADGPVIEGRVVNGTPDGPPVAGAEVELFGLAEGFGRFIPLGSRRTDAQGGFRFTGFDASYDRYGVTVEYRGVAYQSELGGLGQTEPLELEVTAYETTTDPSGLRLQRAHLLAQVEGDRVRLSEILLVANPADRTVVPASREGFLFPLPPGASGVELADPVLASTARTTPQGIYDVTPIPPGVKQVIFSYLLPPGPFERSYPFPVDSVAVFVPQEDGPLLRAAPPRMVDAGPFATQDGLVYRRFEQDGLQAGEPLVLSLALPAASGRSALAPWLAGGGALVLLGLAAQLWRRGRLPGLGRPQPLVDSRELLLAMLAELELGHQRGQISPQLYRHQRRALKDELRWLLAGLPPAAPERP